MSTSDDSIRVWVLVSRVQFWLILILVNVSFAILVWALVSLMRMRRTHYFVFLLAIIVADMVTLSTILFDIVSRSLFISWKGAVLCKVLVFVSSVAACFANWIWLVMFLQRCVLILLPFSRSRGGIVGFIRRTKSLIAITLVTAITTQSWALLLLTELRYATENGLIATTCGRDSNLLSPTGYKWVALFEALSTYVFPFLGTIVLDVGVLYWSQRTTKFAVVSSDTVGCKRESLLSPKSGLKIQSSQSLKSSDERRKRAIRRCFVMATVQVVLNAPYYLLQLLDELYSLQSSCLVFYVYADALLYFLYLCQFPLIAVYIHSMRKETELGRSSTPSSFNSSVVRHRSVRSQTAPRRLTNTLSDC